LAISVVVYNELDTGFAALKLEGQVNAFCALPAVAYLASVWLNPVFVQRPKRDSGGRLKKTPQAPQPEESVLSKLSSRLFGYWYQIACECRERTKGNDVGVRNAGWVTLLGQRVLRNYKKECPLTDAEILALLVWDPCSSSRPCLDPSIGTGLGLRCVKRVKKNGVVSPYATTDMVVARQGEEHTYGVCQRKGYVCDPEVWFTADNVVSGNFPMGKFANSKVFLKQTLQLPRDKGAIRVRKQSRQIKNNARLTPFNVKSTEKIEVGDMVYSTYNWTKRKREQKQ
jgi:hypothetical protein